MDRNDKRKQDARHEDGEYRIVRPEQAHYSDAGYIPQSEAPELRRRYGKAEPKPEKPPRGMRAPTMVALCVICVLLGGVAGGLAGGLVGGKLMDKIRVVWLRHIFAAFLLYGGVRYLL